MGEKNQIFSNLSSLAAKIRNIDGKMIGADQKPLKPRQSVQFSVPNETTPKVVIRELVVGSSVGKKHCA